MVGHLPQPCTTSCKSFHRKKQGSEKAAPFQDSFWHIKTHSVPGASMWRVGRFSLSVWNTRVRSLSSTKTFGSQAERRDFYSFDETHTQAHTLSLLSLSLSL